MLSLYDKFLRWRCRQDSMNVLCFSVVYRVGVVGPESSLCFSLFSKLFLPGVTIIYYNIV